MVEKRQVLDVGSQYFHYFIYLFPSDSYTHREVNGLHLHSLVHSVLSFMCAQLNISNIRPCVEILLLVYDVIVPGGSVKYAFCVKFYIIYKPNPSGKNRLISSFIYGCDIIIQPMIVYATLRDSRSQGV